MPVRLDYGVLRRVSTGGGSGDFLRPDYKSSDVYWQFVPIMSEREAAVLLFLSLCVGVDAVNTGYFWHVTDFHYDHTYWTDQLSCNPDQPVSEPGATTLLYSALACVWWCLNTNLYYMSDQTELQALKIRQTSWPGSGQVMEQARATQAEAADTPRIVSWFHEEFRHLSCQSCRITLDIIVGLHFGHNHG
nr:hypothetical protein BaRGS_025426 [Batillaria attramentaria]